MADDNKEKAKKIPASEVFATSADGKTVVTVDGRKVPASQVEAAKTEK